jgi:hypothetical protein
MESLSRGPTCCRRLNLLEAHLGQIERVDKHIDHANRIALVNEILERSERRALTDALGKQSQVASVDLAQVFSPKII